MKIEMAEAEKIKVTKAQQKQIAQMYKDLADEAATQANQIAGMTGVSEQIKYSYLKALNKRLEAEVDKITKNVEATTKSNMQKVGDTVVTSVEDFMNGNGLVIKGAFSHVPTEVVNSLVTGKVYKGDWNFSKALWQSGEKVKADMYEVVANGVAGQKSTFDIAKDLEKYLNPSALKPWDWKKVYPNTALKVDYSAQRLARTLVQHAYQLNLTRAVKYNPFVTGIEWHSAHSHRTCELCISRDGVIYEKDELPLDHPNGMCQFLSVIPDDFEEISNRVADWYNGNPDPELDLFAIKGLGAKAPAGAALLATNQIKALKSGKQIKTSAVNNLLKKESKAQADKVAAELAAKEAAEKAAKLAKEAAEKAATEKALKDAEEAAKAALEASKLKVYKWSIKEKAYLEYKYLPDEIKGFKKSAKTDFISKNTNMTKAKLGKLSDTELNKFIDDIVKNGQKGAPEVFNIKEAQALVDNYNTNAMDVYKFAVSKGYTGTTVDEAKEFVENMIQKKTKKPKTVKVKPFTTEQKKWLDNKGYTPDKLPTNFAEWSHQLTTAEKTELFNTLNLQGTAHPFQTIEAWYKANIVTDDMIKASAPKPLTKAQMKAMEKDAFSQLRKDKALWAKDTKEADDILREKSGKVWRKASKAQKEAIYDYTGSYHKFNEPLRGIEYGTSQFKGIDNIDLDNIGVSGYGFQKGQVKKLIDNMTKIIEKSSYQDDIWLQRGVEYSGMDKFFGIDPSDFSLSGTDLANKLLGKTVTDGGFFSTGVAKGKGFSNKPLIMNVYAPKGTKMMYAEPFSQYGHGAKDAWDGISKQATFGYESEMILQRGTSFNVIKVEKSGGKIYIDLEVVAQGSY